MVEVLHPAREIPFSDLLEGLGKARSLGFVHRRPDPESNLALFIYTPRCVYEDGWDNYTVLARGLVVDEDAGRVVATPFPKFFNVGERHGDAPFCRLKPLRNSTVA